MRARGSGPFLQGMQIDPPERPTHGTRDGRESLSPCVPELRSARGHCVRPGSPVHLTGMEGLLSAPRADRQFILRIPSPDKRPD